VTWLASTEEHPAPPRLAYAVGRRVGTAVDRNQLRRRLRAAAGELAPDLSGGAYLVAFRGQARTAYPELKQHLATAARSAGAMSGAA